MKIATEVKHDLKTDVNWKRAADLGVKGAQALPSASVKYVLDKVPIVGWLPRYRYQWLLNDVIAGLTVGLMLIPQGLSYAKLADIPVQYGLMSSWLPASLYAFMGTTKDLSTGPTSLIGLLTSEIVDELKDDWSPSEIASAVALMMGVYGMVIGFLKLGFLLEFISLPILSGFISAVAITIILNQMGSLLGESNIGSGTAQQIHDIFKQLPNANGYACAIGFTSILMLTVLDQAYKRWSKHRVVWFLSITRAFLCLVLFTGVGYAVNKHRGDPSNYLFGVAQVKANGQEPPRMPNPELIGLVASRSIAVFIGAAVEHTAIARAFGVRNNYVTDQSQELCYFGLCNFANSFFHAMGVGGAMSRTAVNSSCNVRSPLSGFVTTAVVLVSIFKLVGTLYWIPKATLAAIIICAVWPLISPPQTFYRYWKSSLADFISSMIAFWVCLFVSTEVGIATSVGFNIVYLLLRQVFARMTTASTEPRSELALAIDDSRGIPAVVEDDTRLFRFDDSFFFANAYSLRTQILDVVQTHHAPIYNSVHGTEAERNWSVVGEQRIARLRKAANISDFSSLPPLGLVILDFTKVNHIDVTAVAHLRNLMDELKKYSGPSLQVRFVGMSGYVVQRFERTGWRVDDVSKNSYDGEDIEATKLYRTVAEAVAAPRPRDAGRRDQELKMDLKRLESDVEAVTASHNEQV
ncbi:sulfate transporter 4.1 [Coniochaeta sp. 2T2.1]|nr:sulfate transporter 4.1 [Coniochaeta sp. 2T2.1]